MNRIPSLLSVDDRLARARLELSVTVKNGGMTEVIPLDSLVRNDDRRRNEELMEMLVSHGRWNSTAPAFRGVQTWIEVHWSPERDTRLPEGTVVLGEGFQFHVEYRTDLSIAPKSLIAAASLYGAKTVADYAVDFARHRMIEIRSVYILKGRPVPEPLRLDDYCTLLPYSEALKRGLSADDFLGDPACTPRWPLLPAECVCAVEVRTFRSINLYGSGIRHYTSPLLGFGPDLLALMLGLVWSSGFRLFGDWHRVPEVVAAIVPIPRTLFPGGSGGQRVELPLGGFGTSPETRPLAVHELVKLMDLYARLPEQIQRTIALAMRRLRDSTERSNREDAVIDACIALEVLLTEEGEDWNQRKIVSRRGSWYYADSLPEREQTRELIKAFYEYRSRIVHGKTFGNPTPDEDGRRSKLLADVMNVLRTILKDMISEDRPTDWGDSKNFKSLRHDPPRADTVVRSMKSDSLSWSVAEQKEIDKALEAVWKPTVAGAPSLPPEAPCVVHSGVSPELVELYRKEDVPYVIVHPARLYMAHPKWPKTASGPLDQRTQYYCERDVERHLQAWQEAASKKSLNQFQLANHARFYHPRNRIGWPQPLE
ncbi:MAG: HEPN domain-containing protein [Candidatus Aminicenantes bacterium]|nr:HEPN domain-containing protein [Candidatus Aminicenantes bacterium]